MKKETMGSLGIILISIIWGTSFIYTKNALGSISVFSFMTIRFFISALVITLIFIKKIKNIDKQTMIGGGIIGLSVFAGSGLQTLGLIWTSASNSAFITALFVIIVPFLSAIFFKQKVDVSSKIGALIAMLGMFFITENISAKINIGDALTFLCAIGFAFQILIVSKFAAKFDAIALSIVQLWTLTMLAFIFWGAETIVNGPTPIVINKDVIMGFIMVAFLGTSVAYTLQIISQKYVTPTKAAIILMFEPVFGLLFALIVRDTEGNTETLTIPKIAGCLFVLFATAVSEFKLFNRKYRIMDR